MKIKKVTDLDIQKHFGVKFRNKVNTGYHDFKKRVEQHHATLYLDCHGLSVHQAYNLTKAFIEKHFTIKTRCVTVITGRSGIINQEFPYWIEYNSKVQYIKNMNGSWNLILKRS